MTERDANGRFAKGNQVAKGNGGGPGRPSKEREERFMEITLSAITFADWKKIVQVAAKQAKRGDNQARKFLADYLLGPPPQKHEVKSDGDVRIRVVYERDWDDPPEGAA